MGWGDFCPFLLPRLAENSNLTLQQCLLWSIPENGRQASGSWRAGNGGQPLPPHHIPAGCSVPPPILHYSGNVLPVKSPLSWDLFVHDLGIYLCMCQPTSQNGLLTTLRTSEARLWTRACSASLLLSLHTIVVILSFLYPDKFVFATQF